MEKINAVYDNKQSDKEYQRQCKISQEKSILIHDIKTFRRKFLDLVKVFVLKDPDWETDILMYDLKIIASDLKDDTKKFMLIN